MRKRKVPLIAAAATALLFTIAIQSRPATEASYNGHPVSYWIHLHQGDGSDAKQAIRALGTNCIPHILSLYRGTGDPKIIPSIIEKCLRPLPIRFIPPSLNSWVLRQQPRIQIYDAKEALQILGTNAYPAVPALARIANGKNESQAYSAVFALCEIGGPAIPHLRHLAQNPTPLGRTAAWYCPFGPRTNDPSQN